MMKEQNGITLVALVITIIVLLILAGVTIAALGGENGILTNATKAKQNDEIGAAKDEIALTGQEAMSEYYNQTYAGATAGATGISAAVDGALGTQDAVCKAINTLGTKSGTTITLANGVTFTELSYTAAAEPTADVTITLISKDTKVKCEGTIKTDGSITWNAIANT